MKAFELIPLHHTHSIIDSSKLTTYMDCPRKFFYEYLLAWRPEGANHNLVFGEAWHAALEVLYSRGFTDEAYGLACVAFDTVYRERFAPETDDIYFPKSPANAFEALELYKRVYAADKHRYELLHVEVAGTVPIGTEPHEKLHFRMDVVVRNRDTGMIEALEHKTADRGGEIWSAQWPLSMQVGTYTHALYSLFDPKSVYGVRVNGAIFTKKNIDFIRVPCNRTFNQLQNWFSITNWWFRCQQADYSCLMRETTDQAVLHSYPLNPQSCTKFNTKCAYHDYCVAWPNPLKHIADGPPIGFKTEHWNPADRPAQQIINVETITEGLKDA